MLADFAPAARAFNRVPKDTPRSLLRMGARAGRFEPALHQQAFRIGLSSSIPK